MGKTVTRTYRLDADMVAELEAWAEAHGTTQADAVRGMIAAGLKAGVPNLAHPVDSGEAVADPPRQEEETPADSPQEDKQAAQAELVEAQRRTIDLLSAQLDATQERLKDALSIAKAAQTLHAQAAGLPQLEAQAPQAQEVPEKETPRPQEEEKPLGFFARLARWMGGE